MASGFSEILAGYGSLYLVAPPNRWFPQVQLWMGTAWYPRPRIGWDPPVERPLGHEDLPVYQLPKGRSTPPGIEPAKGPRGHLDPGDVIEYCGKQKDFKDLS